MAYEYVRLYTGKLFRLTHTGIKVSSRFASNINTNGPASNLAVAVAIANPQPAILVVTAIVENGYKTYSITQPPGGPVQTKIKLDASNQYTIGEFQAIEKPKIHPEPVFRNLIVEEHTGSVSWYAPLSLEPGVVSDSLGIKGRVFAQACNKTGCLPPKNHPFVARLGTSPVQLPKVKPLDPAKLALATSNPPPPNEVPTVNTTPEIVTGSRNAQEMASREGALGAFIKGTITTLLATPCSGPFLRTAVGFALGSAPQNHLYDLHVHGTGNGGPLFVYRVPTQSDSIPSETWGLDGYL